MDDCDDDPDGGTKRQSPPYRIVVKSDVGVSSYENAVICSLTSSIPLCLFVLLTQTSVSHDRVIMRLPHWERERVLVVSSPRR